MNFWQSSQATGLGTQLGPQSILVTDFVTRSSKGCFSNIAPKRGSVLVLHSQNEKYYTRTTFVDQLSVKGMRRCDTGNANFSQWEWCELAVSSHVFISWFSKLHCCVMAPSLFQYVTSSPSRHFLNQSSVCIFCFLCQKFRHIVGPY